VLVGRPAELDGKQVIELGAHERAVALPCLGYRQSSSEVVAEVPADSFGLGGEPILQEPPAEGRSERLLVGRSADDGMVGQVRARIRQLNSTILSSRSRVLGSWATSLHHSSSGSSPPAMAVSITPSSRPRLPPSERYSDPLEEGLPGVFPQAVADADGFFAQELPALQQWSFTQQDATRITQPVLGVGGENTAPTFPWRLQLLLSFELPEATHLLHLQNPQGMAEGLAAFYARHPLTAAA
jgi:pimeloyl-ACP methyl ester carboxylesterase